jgi:hypothetical protein
LSGQRSQRALAARKLARVLFQELLFASQSSPPEYLIKRAIVVLSPTASSERFRVYGARASHPRAAELAAEVHDLLFRYAAEIVAGYGLCPFLHNVDTGMGAVGVVLDVEPDVEIAVAALRDLGQNVVHLVYPLQTGGSSAFERFGSRLAQELTRRLPDPLVHATFHPDLTGGTENAHRLVGLLRQAPDPFVQFIPPGLHEGGTVLAGAEPPSEGRAEAMYRRLMQGPADEVLSRLEALRAVRRERYSSLANEISRQLL